MNTLEEGIEFAIDKEAEMAAFYDQLTNLSEAPPSKKIFAELAEMERHHKELLEHLDVSKLPEKTEHKTPDLRISDYMSEVKFTPDIRYPDILIMAMKAEERSHQMYKEMAAQYEPGSDLYRLFDYLTEQEAKHKYMLETEYDEYVLQQD